MEKLKKSRSPLRAAFTRLQKDLLNELAKPTPDKKTLRLLLAKIEDKMSEVTIVDKQILTAMLNDEGVSEDDYGKESEGIDEYKEKLIECRVQVEDVFNPIPTESFQNLDVDGEESVDFKRKFHLPKLEIQKFDGQLKNWLSFWSTYKKIHENASLSSEDKFKFLLQAVTPGSRAREMVESYPPTSENYPKVIETLKNRFGRDDLLVEVYVRELLRLVLHNAIHPKEKVNVTQLYDKLECHMRALETLGVTSDKCASMLFPLVESSLPEDMLRAWQRSSTSTVSGGAADARLKSLMVFLRTEVEGEERIQLSKAGFGLSAEVRHRNKKEVVEEIPTATGLFSGGGNSHSKKNHKGTGPQGCVFCDKKHSSSDCFSAMKMKLEEKTAVLAKKKGCFICLKVGHMARDCRSNPKCVVCTQKHLPIMCPELPSNKQKKTETTETDAASSSSVGMANLSCSQEVCLQTLMVKVFGNGKEKAVRAIIDSASQRSYILKRTAAEAGLHSCGEENLIHVLFGGIQSEQQSHRKYDVQLGTLNNRFKCNIMMLDQRQICHSIPRSKSGPWMQELAGMGIVVSDMGADCPEVEILIGADVAGKLLTGNIRQLSCGLTAIETKLGWTLMGIIPGRRQQQSSSSMLVTTLLTSNVQIADLWKLEAIGIMDSGESKTRALMEEAAKKHFLQTVTVSGDGRFVVHLPWIEGHPVLPSNRILAERRLMSTTKKLISDGRYEQYSDIFKEWLSEGIIEEVSESQLGKNVHFLPHRAVVKESSSTTKVRPVFDASAREKNSPSLNDCLEKGPNLIEEIPSLVLKFRVKRIGVVSDIRKAFLQVAIAEKDCSFLMFLWWADYSKRKLICYRHRRAVFGATSSPFLLAAVLEYHLARAPPHLQSTSDKLSQSFYVDNCVTSVDSKKELVLFMQEAKTIMEAGKFDLRGWEHTWLNDVSNEEAETNLLGMVWNKSTDTVRCNVQEIEEGSHMPVTKRKILSIAHKVFDFIGFTCPVTLFPKTLLQATWKLKAGWDTELPEDISEQFCSWAASLNLLQNVKVPRWFGGSDQVSQKWTLHTFSDASKVAYAACVFLRIEDESGVKVQLVQAKSRVAPLEKLTIPRLELLSCLIGCRLTNMVKKGLGADQIKTCYWSDSSTALCWIQRDDQWATFVGNRVREIRSLSAVEDWRHVPGIHNPADLPSRGCSVKQLLELKWWEGPEWLKKPQAEWPVTSVKWNEEEVDQERRKTVTSLFSSSIKTSAFLSRFSSYLKIVRMMGWMKRFIHNKTHKRDLIGGELRVFELEMAGKCLWRIVQLESFGTAPEENLKSLCVFQDTDGLLKVKTGIANRKDCEAFKCPFLLPPNHPIVHALIREVHLQHSHMGVQSLLTLLRENYWILKGRKTVRSIVHKCIRCRRFTAKKLVSVPIPLPEDRVKTADVFEVTGVDLAGPLYLRGRQKSWIVLFTCAVYRAVHLELVTSLSTDGFLLALRRFVARRGRPSVMYSDNGTNFVGAENLFQKVDWTAVETYSSARRIQWKFNPPSAAWWGGWWERIVSIIKNILRRVLGRASLSYEGFNTILCDCEAVINARPLTYVSEDASDLAPLSPSSFLQERREVGVPDMDAIDHVSANKKLLHRQELMDHLRRRFRSEYLSQLVLRANAKGDNRPVSVGDVVLLGSDNTKRLDWPLAKVLEIYPGKDGNVRVVRVKTATGEFVRPIQRLYPLEVSEKEDPVCKLEEIPQAEPQNDLEQCESPVKVLRTRAGRIVKAPVKFIHSFSSFILI